MIRIGHFADTHLGYRQYGLSEREMDFYEQFNKIIDDMIEKDLDLIIHSGDLFEQPKPPIKALLTAQEGFMKLLKNNIPVYVIAGNHDKLQRTNTAIAQELYENENFHILSYDKPCIFNDELFIGGISYVNSANQDAIAEILKEIEGASMGYKYKILVLHGGTEEHFKLNYEFNNETIPHNFDYYAMGHIHNRVKAKFHEGLLSYPGSTEIRTANEVENYKDYKKGYNLVTIDDSQEKPVNIEYINIPLEREFMVEEIDYPKFEEGLENLYQKINNLDKKPILLLTIQKGDFDRTFVMEEVYKKLKEYCLAIKLRYNPTERTGPINGEVNNEMPTIENMINNYMKKDYPKEVITLTLNLYKELSKANLEEAMNISKSFFENNYKKGDTKNDN